MRIVARKTLLEFARKHPDSDQPLRAWFKVVRQATWKTPADIKSCYRTVDILKQGRVVFDVLNNKYRIVTSIKYAKISGQKQTLGIVFIKFIGTHAEYDKIDANNVSLSLPRGKKKERKGKK